ncbi:unnamed protein product, partial [Ascophyllum nodosum]
RRQTPTRRSACSVGVFGVRTFDGHGHGSSTTRRCWILSRASRASSVYRARLKA